MRVSKGYIKSNLEFKHSFIIAKGHLEIGNKKLFGDFLFDTGSEQEIILDSARAGKEN